MLNTHEMRYALSKKLGKEVRIDKVNKNGREREALVVVDGNVGAVLYTDIVADMTDVDMAVDKLAQVYMHAERPNLNVDDVLSVESLTRNLRIGVQASSADTTLVKRDVPKFDGVEQYLYIDLPMGVIKVRNAQMLSQLEDPWSVAEKNTRARVSIRPLAEFVPIADDSMYVASNVDNVLGASVIALKNEISEFAKRLGVARVAVLPASIHEVILMPVQDDEDIDVRALSAIVREINPIVDDNDILCDHAWLIHA